MTGEKESGLPKNLGGSSLGTDAAFSQGPEEGEGLVRWVQENSKSSQFTPQHHQGQDITTF